MSHADRECVICARFREGRPHDGSVGGYLYDDEHWYAYHAPCRARRWGSYSSSPSAISSISPR